MKNIHSGKGSTKVFMPTLNIYANEVKLTAKDIWLYATFYHEPYLAPQEDDPGCPEYLEIYNVHTVREVYFLTKGIYTWVGQNVDISGMLSEKEIEEVAIEMKKQNNGYVDNDSRRPPIDEVARRELGWGLK